MNYLRPKNGLGYHTRGQIQLPLHLLAKNTFTYSNVSWYFVSSTKWTVCSATSATAIMLTAYLDVIASSILYFPHFSQFI